MSSHMLLPTKQNRNKMLADDLDSAKSKEEGMLVIKNKLPTIEKECNSLISDKGLNYRAYIGITNEYCPARNYSNTTIESGNFDVLNITLGSGNGDNWWCVMYPNICMIDKKKENASILKLIAIKITIIKEFIIFTYLMIL